MRVVSWILTAIRFLLGFLLRRTPPVSEAPVGRRVTKGGPLGKLIPPLAKAMPRCDTPDGKPWDARKNLSVEDGRLAIDLHGLSVREASSVTESAVQFLAPHAPSPLRLITGHGRARDRGYSELRVALFERLFQDKRVQIVDPERHRQHRNSDDRLGHMDIDVIG